MSTSSARWFLLLCIIAGGCGVDGQGQPCRDDTECASGFCRADGTCAPVDDVDAGPTIDAPPDDGTVALCVPNHDGNVVLDELPHEPGKMATFRVATNATFATAGTASGNGMRRWDLTAALSNDTDRALALMSPAGTWWAASFPSATYAAVLAADSDLLGVFRASTNAIELLGVVSPAAGATRTELEYDPPAKILSLPVTAGGTWTSTSTVSGVALGTIVAYTEKYASLVDQVGTMKTPYGEFPVLRTATDLTRTSGFATLLTSRSFSWVAECFGSIANVRSRDFESSSEFDDPAEVRRLAP